MRRGSVTSWSQLFDHLDPVNGCWVWKGLVSDGYGLNQGVHSPSETRLVHRKVYEFLVGPIPETMTLDHLCRNRACCNPAHLEPVSIKDNVMRGEGACAQHARKTHCKRGHEFTPENTGKASKDGRYCIQCSRDAAKAQRARNHKGKRMWTVNAPVHPPEQPTL